MFNAANTGFMLLAASLVMLMTPGLAFFYGGLVGRSNTLTIMIQSFALMGITTVMWWIVGYSLCFSGGSDGIYGNFHVALLRHIDALSLYKPSGIPTVVAETRIPKGPANAFPGMTVSWDQTKVKITPAEVVKQLLAGKPSIFAGGRDKLSIGVVLLQPEEVEIVAKRVKEILNNNI